MKKSILLSLLLLVGLTLSACGGGTEEELAANVIFFVGNNNPNSIPSLLDVPVNETIEMPEEPSRPGFEFLGWYKDVELTESWDFENDVVESSIVLYAKWDAAEYNVIYDLNGGEIIGVDYTQTFFTGDFKTLPTARRDGFSFISWYLYDWEDETSTIPGDSGLQRIPEDQTEDLYLYAHWRAIVVTVLFRANYPVEDEGPANPNSRSVPYGEIINFPVLEDTDDYVFMGWNSNPEGTGTWYYNDDQFLRTQRLTLYAIWQPK